MKEELGSGHGVLEIAGEGGLVPCIQEFQMTILRVTGEVCGLQKQNRSLVEQKCGSHPVLGVFIVNSNMPW